ncbi:MAG: type 2 lantipeptide synthetase LanM family protein [Lachnospiraceae bacterium]|nr:type 2 lantipeptide synthetase LanM family protein [Lachnospiraceae bacterium]
MNMQLEQIYWQVSCEVVDDGVFLPFYFHFVEVLKTSLSRYCETKGLTVPNFDAELVKSIIGQLKRISLRTLILEMNLSERCGELVGKDGKEMYHFYVNQKVSNNEYLQEIYKIYPELYKALFQELERCMRNIRSVLEKFEQDKTEINKSFFAANPAHFIRKIGGGDSDSHNGGKRVYWVELDNGERIVYKPRSLAIDKMFQEFVGYVSNGCGIGYQWNNLLDKTEYGWCSWVKKKDCDTRRELEDYYFRIGILLCITYLLGAEDMHYENLIANGEFPILVDLEMGVGCRGIVEDKIGFGAINKVYRESVLHTGILPLYAWNEKGEGVNVGAMNGRGGQLCPIKMPVVVETGTTNMHIEYRQPVMAESKNLAMMNGTFIEPYEFLEQIQAGFEAAYLMIVGDKEKISEWIDEFGKVPVRYLFRETQQYAMMLNSSYHPQYLMSRTERCKSICCLNRGEEKNVDEFLRDKKEWIYEQEEKDLYEGDIPYFWYIAEDCALHSSTGEVYLNYFEQPVIERIRNRLQKMNGQDLGRQQRFIRNALFIGTKKMEDENRNGEYDSENMELEGSEEDEVRIGLSIAEKIGDILLEEAIWTDDKENVGWISMVMAGYQERGYLIRPMNYYLYDGLAGVAVFIASLVKKSSSNRFFHVYETLIQQLFDYTDKTALNKEELKLPTGAYAGEASLVYAYLLLYERTGEEKFRMYMERHCEIVSRCLKQDKVYDVLAGNAGAILVLLKVFEKTGDQKYLSLAVDAGDILIDSSTTYEWGVGWVNNGVEKALTGFAHGVSGMILALCKLGYYTGKEVYYDFADKAFLFEQHYFMPEIGDWADLRFEDHKQDASELVWCHGKGGIVAAYTVAIKYAEPRLRKKLEKAIEKVDWHMRSKHESAYCLCHGAMGTVGLQCAMGHQEDARGQYRRLLKRLSMVGKDRLRKLMPLQECDNFGLMGGLCGIGYGCMEGIVKIAELLFV